MRTVLNVKIHTGRVLPEKNVTRETISHSVKTTIILNSELPVKVPSCVDNLGSICNIG